MCARPGSHVYESPWAASLANGKVFQHAKLRNVSEYDNPYRDTRQLHHNMAQKCFRRPDDIPGGGDGYDTDMDDKMGLSRSPSRHPLQDTGLDVQATQAGVSCMPCLLCALPFRCPAPSMLGPQMRSF